MSFLDKAKKLAEQAAEKAGPLIDKAAPHAQNVVDKAGQQIDRRTGGKYHDKIEAVEAKVGEMAEKRLAGRGGAAGDTAGAPGAGADEFPARPAPVDASAGTAPSGTTTPAQPDLSGGQPDDPAHSGVPSGGFSTGPAATSGAEPAFSADEPDITFPAPVPGSTYRAEPDSRAGQPDDPTHSLAPGGTGEFPGLSEGTLGAPRTDDDRPSGPPVGGSGTP